MCLEHLRLRYHATLELLMVLNSRVGDKDEEEG